jgi:threonylcarbamoyladenosine tRNA methylthiotransferase MtaB
MNEEKNKVMGYTLGCRLNQADTALIFGRLEKDGYSVIKPENESTPDLIIVNTCTVTANAAQKSRQATRSLRKKYPQACVIVSGCDCEKGIGGWESESAVDIIIPNAEKKDISKIVAEWKEKRRISHHTKKDKPFVHKTASDEEILESDEEKGNMKSIETPDIDVSFREDAIADYPFRSRAFLKVQEGCNSFCTYCIVPYVRGRERSRNLDEVLEEAKALIKRGHREIVVTGVNISAYRNNDTGITDLVEKLARLEGDFRIRLSSMEPHSENRNLVELIKKYKKICRFLHIPLQHGTDTILNSMGRNYTTADFSDFMNYAFEQVPGIHLGTDVIVGFPGESDELFRESCDFISSLPIANAHIFRFSPRKGTPAATFPEQVPQRITKQRAGILEELTDEMKNRFLSSQKGKKIQVLVESKLKNGCFSGWTDNYIKAELQNSNLKPGHFTEWTVT